MRTFITVEEARETVLESCGRLADETVPLAAARGRVLSGDVQADGDHPRFDNSAVDGYAVSAEDLARGPSRLEVAGEIAAGAVVDARLGVGRCYRIMTGARIPAGTAAVVPIEWAVGDDGRTVTFERVPPPEGNVRRAGEDVRAGERVLPAGTRVGAAAAGLLAMFGVVDVPVVRRPSVSIVSTGSELVAPSERPGEGQLRNSNATALAHQAVDCGADVSGMFHARDDRAELDAAIETARGCDLLVFTGGVSVGRYDLVQEALLAAGMETVFWKVRQRPGKPLLFGILGGTPVLGLPGNPVSSSVCFDQYARPAILKMSGRPDVLRARHGARLAADFVKPEGLHVFARGVAKGDPKGILAVLPAGGQGSHVFSSVLRTNCLVHLPADWPAAAAGAAVEIEWTDW